MKYVLATMCALVILFMGGCSLLSMSAAFFNPFNALIWFCAVSVVILNVFVLGGIFDWKWQWKPAFYILGVVDLLIAVGVVISLWVFSAQMPYLIFILVVSGMFAIKAIWTFVFATQSRPPAL